MLKFMFFAAFLLAIPVASQARPLSGAAESAGEPQSQVALAGPEQEAARAIDVEKAVDKTANGVKKGAKATKKAGKKGWKKAKKAGKAVKDAVKE